MQGMSRRPCKAELETVAASSELDLPSLPLRYLTPSSATARLQLHWIQASNCVVSLGIEVESQHCLGLQADDATKLRAPCIVCLCLVQGLLRVFR